MAGPLKSCTPTNLMAAGCLFLLPYQCLPAQRAGILQGPGIPSMAEHVREITLSGITVGAWQQDVRSTAWKSKLHMQAALDDQSAQCVGAGLLVLWWLVLWANKHPVLVYCSRQECRHCVLCHCHTHESADSVAAVSVAGSLRSGCWCRHCRASTVP